jgi:DNA-binding transcriptional LysR family regulator
MELRRVRSFLSIAETLHFGRTASEMPTLVSLVAAEMGISILPASALRHKVRGVVARAIVGPTPMSEIGLAVGRDNSNPLVESFKTLALEILLHTQGKKDTRKANGQP